MTVQRLAAKSQHLAPAYPEDHSYPALNGQAANDQIAYHVPYSIGSHTVTQHTRSEQRHTNNESDSPESIDQPSAHNNG
jgi:hypothetical protein